MVWYEYGSGISTSNDSKLLSKLSEDCINVLKYIKTISPNNAIIDFLFSDSYNRIAKHPIISLKRIIIRGIAKLTRYKKFLNKTNDFFKIVTSDLDLIQKEG